MKIHVVVSKNAKMYRPAYIEKGEAHKLKDFANKKDPNNVVYEVRTVEVSSKFEEAIESLQQAGQEFVETVSKTINGLFK